MTTKHRRGGRGNHKPDDGALRADPPEPDSGAGRRPLLLLLLLLAALVAVAAAWFGFQQHQSLGRLTAGLSSVQMTVVQLQSFQEEMRRTHEKKQNVEGFEHRLHSLEESYLSAQNQVNIALATAEQMKSSDLPAQVLALHTELNSRMLEMKRTMVSPEDLSQLQALFNGQQQEFDAVKQQLSDLIVYNAELAQKVQSFSDPLSSQVDINVTELQQLRDQLATQRGQLQTGSEEITGLKALLEAQGNVEEQLNTLRQSLQKQSMVTESLHLEHKAQLEAVKLQLKNIGEQVDALPVEESSRSEVQRAEMEMQGPTNNVGTGRLEEDLEVFQEYKDLAGNEAEEVERKTPINETNEESSEEENGKTKEETTEEVEYTAEGESEQTEEETVKGETLQTEEEINDQKSKEETGKQLTALSGADIIKEVEQLQDDQDEQELSTLETKTLPEDRTPEDQLEQTEEYVNQSLANSEDKVTGDGHEEDPDPIVHEEITSKEPSATSPSTTEEGKIGDSETSSEDILEEKDKSQNPIPQELQEEDSIEQM
ncbi:centrosome-associated protein CEP250 [Denticeps clupeoides]|uniref:Uncharacterized protein n=1 Tax=Denticeps clupeoides TaxID=299321 RepID=A0AAY4CB38_9TELE|nr:centrosome-associated protein CEP250-like [Denticeps clupeoides]